MKSRRAIVTWVPAAKGGRGSPPDGPKYRSVARFVSDPTWPAQAWSLGIERVKPMLSGDAWLADVRWLAPSAPHDVLKTGERFEVYEGRRIVAHGLIVASNRPAPPAGTVRQLMLT